MKKNLTKLEIDKLKKNDMIVSAGKIPLMPEVEPKKVNKKLLNKIKMLLPLTQVTIVNKRKVGMNYWYQVRTKRGLDGWINSVVWLKYKTIVKRK